MLIFFVHPQIVPRLKASNWVAQFTRPLLRVVFIYVPVKSRSARKRAVALGAEEHFHPVEVLDFHVRVPEGERLERQLALQALEDFCRCIETR